MTTGVKYDQGKPPLSLIPRRAQVAEAEVLAFGLKKYAAHNWRGGIKWSRLIDAALRHITAFSEGEDLDPESGRSHLAHARCCLGFLLEYLETHPDLDDRYKPPRALSLGEADDALRAVIDAALQAPEVANRRVKPTTT